MQRFICLPLALIVLSTANAQTKTTKALTTPVPANQGDAKAIEANADGITAAVLKSTPSPGADYIPCKFTYNELQSLVVPERKLTLTPADAESLVQNVLDEVQNQQTAGLIDASTAQAFISGLNSEEFVDLTPTQAISLIRRILQVVKATARVQSDLSAATQAADAAADSTRKKDDREASVNLTKKLATDARLAAREAYDTLALGENSEQQLPAWLKIDVNNAEAAAMETSKNLLKLVPVFG